MSAVTIRHHTPEADRFVYTFTAVLCPKAKATASQPEKYGKSSASIADSHAGDTKSGCIC